MNNTNRYPLINFLSLLAALLLALLAVGSARAGGWAVISVEPLPGTLQPGQPFTVDFFVLQHGERPMVDLDPAPQVTFRNTTGESLILEAEELDEPGRYHVEVTLPTAGSWDWSIQAFTVTQAMPPLQVTAREAAAMPAVFEQPAALTAGLLLGGALLLAGLALYLLRRPAKQLAPLLLVLSLFLGVGALLTGGRALANEPDPVAGPPAAVQLDEAALVEQGNATFTRRGCITCHANRRVAIPAAQPINWAPDLSHYQASPEFLRQWLADPHSVRPQTLMPNLGLQEDEIEALISFLNQDLDQK